MTDDSKGPPYEGLDGARLVVGLDLATPPGQVSAAQLLRFETMPDGTTRAFRVAPPPAKPTDAELLEAARRLLWELIDDDGAELHEIDDDGRQFCPEDSTCTCPRVAVANRILAGWKP